FFFFQAEDGIRDKLVTGVQTCALPILQRRLTIQKGRRCCLPPHSPRPARLIIWRAFDLSVERIEPTRSKVSISASSPGVRVPAQIGRASCRESEEVSGVAG